MGAQFCCLSLLFLVAACGGPTANNGAFAPIQCGPAGECPAGMVCTAGGLCAVPYDAIQGSGNDTVDSGTPDGADAIDDVGALIDAAVDVGLMDADGEVTTPTTFCSESDKPVCKGNYVATCTGAGTAYKLLFCGENNRCEAGGCVAVICPRGQLTCSGKNVMKCPDDGASEPVKVQTCTTMAGCVSGVCKPNTCKKDDVVCGSSTSFTCQSGVVTESPCSSNQTCSVAAKGCVAEACTPTEAKCKDSTTAQVCNVDALGWTTQACPSGQGCFDGVCHPILADKSVADAGSTKDTATGQADGVIISTGDTLVGPQKDVQFTKPDEFSVTFSKTKTPGASDKPTVLDMPSASYSKFTQILTVSGDKDLFKIAIQVGKIEEYTTGPFTQVDGQAPDSVIMVNDSSNDQTQVQWIWKSADYDMELTEFGDINTGRIVGTFSSDLINTVDKTTKAYLTGGKFDIVHK